VVSIRAVVLKRGKDSSSRKTANICDVKIWFHIVWLLIIHNLVPLLTCLQEENPYTIKIIDKIL
jgi:hypothetical protein